ncbi:uncharacterized protein METZ01_LOCUS402870, partial [marine metagenome]
MIYKNILRPLLFSLDPETAHKLYEFSVQYCPFIYLPFQHSNKNQIGIKKNLSGLEISNRVGLAAGFDKNGRVFHSIGKFGFGYVVVGTVTLNVNEGNAKPRFRRLSEAESLINSMGFPNDGANEIVRRISRNRLKFKGVPVVVSISGTNISEISECLKIVEPYAEAVELNLSSPNTKGIKIFHEEKNFKYLIEELNRLRSKPLWVKLPSYGHAEIGNLSGESYEDSKELVMNLVKFSVDLGVDALTIGNSRSVKDTKMATGFGGL